MDESHYCECQLLNSRMRSQYHGTCTVWNLLLILLDSRTSQAYKEGQSKAKTGIALSLKNSGSSGYWLKISDTNRLE
ncbi:hypothetical protein J6590_076427 [Homalodisca vitripennis]|nr:hypothetical protein J6590_076427 [Homalodisca vitripennis]